MKNPKSTITTIKHFNEKWSDTIVGGRHISAAIENLTLTIESHNASSTTEAKRIYQNKQGNMRPDK
jgi:hypothetical protein